MKYHVRIYYDEKGSNVEYTTDTGKEQLKEQFCEILNKKLPLIVNTKNGISIINPEKIIFFEVEELNKMNDLTEQWKKGELPEGWYWVKDDEGQIKLAEYSLYCIDRETNETEYDWSCLDEIEQVLAEVPSYDEWKAAQEQLHKEGIWYTEISHKKVLKENAQLKELLKECKEVFDECFSPSVKYGELYKQIDEVLK